MGFRRAARAVENAEVRISLCFAPDVTHSRRSRWWIFLSPLNTGVSEIRVLVPLEVRTTWYQRDLDISPVSRSVFDTNLNFKSEELCSINIPEIP